MEITKEESLMFGQMSPQNCFYMCKIPLNMHIYYMPYYTCGIYYIHHSIEYKTMAMFYGM